MWRFYKIIFLLLITGKGYSQALPRPKLVVGIVVDQMRWDYLYRYYDRYNATGGFKRMLKFGNDKDPFLKADVPNLEKHYFNK